MGLPQWNIFQVPPSNARLFLGLWPTTETLQQLTEKSKYILQYVGGQGRVLASQHWHITLAFLGPTTASYWHQLVSQASTWSLQIPPSLVLDRVGRFEKAQVLWLGADPKNQVYLQLQQAQQQLWQYLKNIGWETEERDFVPHVSLLRRAQLLNPVLPTLCPLVWHNAALKLIVSVPNSSGSNYYQVLDLKLEWPKHQD